MVHVVQVFSVGQIWKCMAPPSDSNGGLIQARHGAGLPISKPVSKLCSIVPRSSVSALGSFSQCSSSSHHGIMGSNPFGLLRKGLAACEGSSIVHVKLNVAPPASSVEDSIAPVGFKAPGSGYILFCDVEDLAVQFSRLCWRETSYQERMPRAPFRLWRNYLAPRI